MSTIEIRDDSRDEDVSVKRVNNVRGRNTTQLSITLPTELHQTINGIVVETRKSRSLVITELLEAGLKGHE